MQLKVIAQASNTETGLRKWSASVGLPTGEGIFGFRPFAEQWCGRLAMMGFVISIVQEFITSKGTLAQINLMDGSGQPDFAVLGLLCAVFGGATLWASVTTLNKIRNKELSPMDVARYKNFLALNNEKAQKEAAAAMKAAGDFTTPGNNMAAIKASKAEGAPVDAFLSTNELAEGGAAASKMKADGVAAQEPTVSPQGPALSLEKRKEIEDMLMFSPDAELAFAQQVELTNGRSAMMGFLAAVLVEAATGKGIIMQIIMWLKLTGFLGAESGF